MSYPVVALDVDGVLSDFEGHWMRCAGRILGRDIQKQSDQYDLMCRFGLTKKEFDAVWDSFHATEWGNVPLHAHAQNLVFELEDIGCEVWSVTSIDAKHHEVRAESLAGLIPYERIICVGTSQQLGGHGVVGAQKASVLQSLGAVAFLDDQPDNANAAANVVDLSVYLDLKYQGLGAVDPRVTVIDDPMDFPVLVENLLNRTRRYSNAFL